MVLLTNVYCNTKKKSPLDPIRVFGACVAKTHVKQRRENESQQGDAAGADQIHDTAEARDALRDEEQDEDAEGPKHASFPAELGRDVQDELEELRRRVRDDREGGHQMEQQANLDDQTHDAGADAQNHVILHLIPECEVGSGAHGQVNQKQD